MTENARDIDEKQLSKVMDYLLSNDPQPKNLDFLTANKTNGFSPLLPQKPGHTLILGKTGSGKTNNLVCLLKNFPRIARVDYIAHNPEQASIYALQILSQIKGAKFQTIGGGEDREEQSIPDLNEYDPDKINVLILDDFLQNKKFVEKDLAEALFTARHHGVYVYALVQDMRPIQPAVRRQFSHFIIFKDCLKRKRDAGVWRAYLETFSGEPEFVMSCLERLEHHHDFLYLDPNNTNPRLQVRKNFCELIVRDF